MLLSFLVLAGVYLLQDAFSLNQSLALGLSAETDFVLKKLIRIVLNDTAALVLIYAWFYDAKITRLAFLLQLVDTFILLPVYLVLKLSIEGTAEISVPLLSQLHRLIVNPTLIILLIPAIYFQRIMYSQK
ncbi:exosortase F system-associated protein [Chryseotalea sanaruensis]|uniref:Exosortase F system-associated protein n=2 Tax=Chryseotalea sanaruensis TaxID=2482724 RepID=A0A401U6N0_9BACT|nr:exosortase F system-associated protein [Chryseotalea sanaruensis]